MGESCTDIPREEQGTEEKRKEKRDMNIWYVKGSILGGKTTEINEIEIKGETRCRSSAVEMLFVVPIVRVFKLRILLKLESAIALQQERESISFP
jgi:hypothetical protein